MDCTQIVRQDMFQKVELINFTFSERRYKQNTSNKIEIIGLFGIPSPVSFPFQVTEEYKDNDFSERRYKHIPVVNKTILYIMIDFKQNIPGIYRVFKEDGFSSWEVQSAINLCFKITYTISQESKGVLSFFNIIGYIFDDKNKIKFGITTSLDKIKLTGLDVYSVSEENTYMILPLCTTI